MGNVLMGPGRGRLRMRSPFRDRICQAGSSGIEGGRVDARATIGQGQALLPEVGFWGGSIVTVGAGVVWMRGGDALCCASPREDGQCAHGTRTRATTDAKSLPKRHYRY